MRREPTRREAPTAGSRPPTLPVERGVVGSGRDFNNRRSGLFRYRVACPSTLGSFDPVALEKRVLEQCASGRLHESLRRRSGAPEWVFYEGPPTANGRPGIHHVWARLFKDLYPRYHTMRGRHVARKAGWDCHGLPVEVEVEKELGFSGKTQIEAYGIEAFNRRCRESVQRYVGDFEALTERIGMWLDVADAYWTMSDEYIESVWWHIRSMWDAGNLYEGHRSCPSAGAAERPSPATARPAGAYRDVTRLGLRPLPTGRRRCDCSSGPPRRGRSCPNVGRRSAPTSTT